ncbi:MAG TPA: hypothetical protein VE505_00445 [Vicinamibacterales bacterium]|nr:hypothetical protein [Vicinamibacterales bacterium]
MLQHASILLLYGFIVLPILVAVALSAIIWRAVGAEGYPRRQTNRLQIRLALGAVAWLAITLWVSAAGVLRHFERQPPPMPFLVAAVFALAGWLACSWIGDLVVRHTSWVVLVGLQGFRLPLELLMHRAYVEGIMPVQMSYSGRSFDIVTGASAIVLALALARFPVPRWVIAVWNVLGSVLLVNILVIAIASMPMFHWFGMDRLNVWVADPPFVWLPAVLVLTALAGHLLMFRKLRRG